MKSLKIHIIKIFIYSLFFTIFCKQPLQANQVDIEILPNVITRGTAGQVVIKNLPEDAQVTGVFDQRPIFFYYFNNKFIGFFGADIMLNAGSYPIEISYLYDNKEESQTANVIIQDKYYKLKNNQLKTIEDLILDAELQKRQQKNKAEFEAKNFTKLWQAAFIPPISAPVSNSFGRNILIDDTLKSYFHAGTEFFAPPGTKVKASASGQILSATCNLSPGCAVYIDHGLGIISMYFHLSSIKVQTGEHVKQGQVIALSGRSGATSKAFLHYGIYINGARIDPMAFHKLSTLNSR